MSENKLEELKGAHNLNCDHVLDILETNIDTGLTNGQVEERRKIYGRNELPKPEQVSLFHRVKEQFEDLLVRILLVSAVISFTIAMFGKHHPSLILINSIQKTKDYYLINLI